MDRAIVNRLQRGFPVCERPFAETGGELGLSEQDMLARISALLESGVLTRFGPMYDAEQIGGKVSLCAMRVPEGELDHVAGIVNAFPEVAHNYQREHRFNMWFVVASETPDEIPRVLQQIEHATGYPVLSLPKQEEFFVGLHLDA